MHFREQRSLEIQVLKNYTAFISVSSSFSIKPSARSNASISALSIDLGFGLLDHRI